jgi:hypothetical protein
MMIQMMIFVYQYLLGVLLIDKLFGPAAPVDPCGPCDPTLPWGPVAPAVPGLPA